MRHINNAVEGDSNVRYESTEDGDFAVVPATIFREQVYEYPEKDEAELLPAEHIEASADRWDGVRATIGHPGQGQGPTPEFAEFRNPEPRNNGEFLDGEVWIDQDAASRHPDGRAILQAIENGETLSVSPGYDLYDEGDIPGYEPESGRHNGEEYDGVQGIPSPDHVAIFPPDALAMARCSPAAGCRVNALYTTDGGSVDADADAESEATAEESDAVEADGGVDRENILAEARTPEFDGLVYDGESSSTVDFDPYWSLSDYLDAWVEQTGAEYPGDPYSALTSIPDAAREWIAERSLLGDPDARTEENLMLFNVVSPGGRLHESRLESVLGEHGARVTIPEDQRESAREVARQLLEDEFGRDLTQRANAKRSTPRDPTYNGTTTADWDAPSLNEYIDAFATEADQDADSVEDLSQESKTRIASKTLLGNANADTAEDLRSFPVVTTGNDLSESALDAVLSRAPQAEYLSEDEIEALQDKAYQLLEEEFDRERENAADPASDEEEDSAPDSDRDNARRTTPRDPSYNGTTTGEWERPTFSEYVTAFATADDQDAEEVTDLSQESKNAIASKTLLGNANASLADELISLPVVTTENNLHESALDAALSRAPQAENLSAAEVNRVQSKARDLLEEEFDRDIRDNSLDPEAEVDLEADPEEAAETLATGIRDLVTSVIPGARSESGARAAGSRATEDGGDLPRANADAGADADESDAPAASEADSPTETDDPEAEAESQSEAEADPDGDAGGGEETDGEDDGAEPDADADAEESAESQSEAEAESESESESRDDEEATPDADDDAAPDDSGAAESEGDDDPESDSESESEPDADSAPDADGDGDGDGDGTGESDGNERAESRAETTTTADGDGAGRETEIEIESMKDQEKVDILVEEYNLDRENMEPLKGEDCLDDIFTRFHADTTTDGGSSEEPEGEAEPEEPEASEDDDETDPESESEGEGEDEEEPADAPTSGSESDPRVENDESVSEMDEPVTGDTPGAIDPDDVVTKERANALEERLNELERENQELRDELERPYRQRREEAAEVVAENTPMSEEGALSLDDEDLFGMEAEVMEDEQTMPAPTGPSADAQAQRANAQGAPQQAHQAQTQAQAPNMAGVQTDVDRANAEDDLAEEIPSGDVTRADGGDD